MAEIGIAEGACAPYSERDIIEGNASCIRDWNNSYKQPIVAQET